MSKTEATDTAKNLAKRVFIKSYGCQMNVYDAQRMADVLAPEGYAETSTIEDADLVILNTCHIREKAVDKVYSELGRVRELKKEREGQGHDTRVVVAGCVAQAMGNELLKGSSTVDLVVGPQSYQNLPTLLKNTKKRQVETEFPIDDKFNHLPAPSREAIRSRGVSAFVTVQEGCDKFCTFCVVPYTRGAEVSRPVQDVLADIARLADAGVREVTLLGQNVNAYHGLDADGQSITLAGLMERVARISGIKRIRYMTSHPRDTDDELLRAHRDNEALMPYFHLPVQSGSDRILDVMNRKHTAADYLSIIAKLRAYRPDIAFTSDFIVGFPGETEEDFQATMRLVEEVTFATAYTFKYSPRPGTPAAELEEQVPEDVKDRRLQALQALIAKQQRAFQESMVGKVLDVLVDRKGKKPGQLTGKSPHMLAVSFEADPSLMGEVVQVEVTESGTNSLVGTLVQPERAVA